MAVPNVEVTVDQPVEGVDGHDEVPISSMHKGEQQSPFWNLIM